MKLYAPKYYSRFSCIADKCKHSCCVGWEIDIDRATMDVYSSLEGRYAQAIRDSIDIVGTPHFSLVNDRCPHLCDNGLCKIIAEMGMGFLCDICREHPRFYNDTPSGKEVGIGMSCEEACRIILTSDDYSEFIEIDDIDGEPDLTRFNTIFLRKKIYSVLKNRRIPYSDRLLAIYKDFNIRPSVQSDIGWNEVLTSLEYLDESHRNLFSSYSSDLSSSARYEDLLKRALAYFVFRHCGDAIDEREYRYSLGLCLFLERLLASVLKKNESDDIESCFELARILSEEIEYCEDNVEIIKAEFQCFC